MLAVRPQGERESGSHLVFFLRATMFFSFSFLLCYVLVAFLCSQAGLDDFDFFGRRVRRA